MTQKLILQKTMESLLKLKQELQKEQVKHEKLKDKAKEYRDKCYHSAMRITELKDQIINDITY